MVLNIVNTCLFVLFIWRWINVLDDFWLILTELQEINSHKFCQEKRIYRLSSGKRLYWPLKPKIFLMFDNVFICTENEPPVQWFHSKFENRHTLIYLFWLYIKLSYLFWNGHKKLLEVTHNKIYQDFIAEQLNLFQNMGFNNTNRAKICYFF